jgi:hypothetical protein
VIDKVIVNAIKLLERSSIVNQNDEYDDIDDEEQNNI